jgi:hypothetical protein
MMKEQQYRHTKRIIIFLIMVLCSKKYYLLRGVNGFSSSLSSPASSSYSSFHSKIENQLILAPLTRGGNLAFRRLCSDYGMEVSFSEMVCQRLC